MLLADTERGIAIERFGVFNKIADAIFDGRARELYPDAAEEESVYFAKEIKKLDKDLEDESER